MNVIDHRSRAWSPREDIGAAPEKHGHSGANVFHVSSGMLFVVIVEKQLVVRWGLNQNMRPVVEMQSRRGDVGLPWMRAATDGRKSDEEYKEVYLESDPRGTMFDDEWVLAGAVNTQA